ncbi:EF-Hand 1, calcium-binding site [Sesbania bispinosa]|nr:EF-Hand 1, calcium-binding site [Sesbania bispinosa]
MPVFIPNRVPAGFNNSKGLPQDITIAEKQVRDILRKADGNGDGCLSKDELKKAFKEFGFKMPSWRACYCLRKADTNRDGQICHGEELDIVVDYVLARYKLKK